MPGSITPKQPRQPLPDGQSPGIPCSFTDSKSRYPPSRMMSGSAVNAHSSTHAATLPVPPQCGHSVSVGGVNGMTSDLFFNCEATCLK
jgi:hypothetical protein